MVTTKDELSSFVALKGQQGLSEFRLKALAELIRRDFSDIQSINCKDFFFCSLADESNELRIQTEDRLSKILKAKVIKGELKANQFVLIPRIGTISPWSSKATDILSNAGLKPLKRIEKGLCFSLKTQSDLNEKSIIKIGQKIYDRMTQAVITKVSDAQKLFKQTQPKPVLRIDILVKGKKSLQEANSSLGLALSEEEIDYLYNSYQEKKSYFKDLDCS